MAGKFLLLAAGALLLTGCGMFDDPVPKPTPLNQTSQSAPAGTSPASAAKTEKTAAAKRPAPEKKPTGLEAELNDVERSYLREVRDRNARSERANENKIFGAFSPANLVSGQN